MVERRRLVEIRLHKALKAPSSSGAIRPSHQVVQLPPTTITIITITIIIIITIIITIIIFIIIMMVKQMTVLRYNMIQLKGLLLIILIFHGV